ncbi:MAG: MFS transporter [Phycisphaerae bacterium]|jgi:fucose permease|nr:MAG: MFS transporter [Phycisphaerae bacterium]
MSGFKPFIQRLWLVIAASYVAMMSLAIAINFLPVFLTTLAGDLAEDGRLDDQQLGLIGSVTFAGLVTGILISGPLADRWGPRLFSVGGNVLIAVGLCVIGLADSYAAVMYGSAVMGLGAGALDMILSPIIAAVQPRRRTLSMNLLHSFYCLGAVMTILAGSLALRWGYGWREVAWGLLPLPAVLGLIFAVIGLPPLMQDHQRRVPTRQLMIEPVFVALMIAICMGGATEAGMAYWLPAYAETTLGFSQWISGISLVGFSLAMVIGRLGIMLLPAGLDAIKLMLVCCLVTTILFPVASFAGSREVALTACMLVGLSGSCLWPSTLAVAADRYPTGGATMFALLAALGNVGGIIMPWVVGVVADATDLRWGLATATLCPVLMIISLFWIRFYTRFDAPRLRDTSGEIPVPPTGL